MDMKYKLSIFIRFFAGTLLFTYLLFIAWRMLFHAYGAYYRSYSAAPEYNIIPFKTIESLIVNFRYYKLEVWIYNLFGNIAAFMPLGFLLPLAISLKKKLLATVLFSTVFLLAAESAQLVFRVGVFDVDDIILNILGVLVGYLGYRFISKLEKKLIKSFD